MRDCKPVQDIIYIKYRPYSKATCVTYLQMKICRREQQGPALRQLWSRVNVPVQQQLVQFLHNLKHRTITTLQVLNSSGKTMQNVILAQVIRAKSVSRCSTLDSHLLSVNRAARSDDSANPSRARNVLDPRRTG